jgi:tryptophan-rich sensory protein
MVLGVGILIGMSFPPGEWYAGLTKPAFNPPNWLFGPVWTMLYVMIAIAGWRSYLRERFGLSMKLWIAQLFLNWAWTPVFFGAHLLWAALLVVLAMAAAILAFIVQTWPRDRLSAVLMLPYLAWVSFASLLNLSLAWLNG